MGPIFTKLLMMLFKDQFRHFVMLVFWGFFGIGEGPEYRPFRDLRSVPEAGRLRNRSKITEGPVLRSFSYVKQSWDFFTF